MGCHAEYINWGEGFGWGLPIIAWGLAGHRSAGGEQLYCASLGFFSPFPSDFIRLPFPLLFIIAVVVVILLCYCY